MRAGWNGCAGSLLLALAVGGLAGCGGDGDGLTVGSSRGPTPVPSADSIFLNVVPPGANGNSAGGIGSPVPGAPVLQYPPNFEDQLHLYGNLAYAQQGLKAETCVPPKNIGEHQQQSDQACNYFKDHGLEPDTVVSTLELTAPNGKKVTIRRNGWGVPFVNGEDRAAAEYGLGYATAQDRLWLWDVLRYVGRGRTSEFLGPSSTTYDLDQQFGGGAGYSEEELTDITNAAIAKIGPLGPLFLSDAENLVAGMNAYIASLQTPEGFPQIPPEYVSLALAVPPKFPPRDFTVNDIVANAVLIQAVFGRGGGGEDSNLNLLQKLDSGFGPNSTSIAKAACDLWRDLRHANDPDAAYTSDISFPTQSPSSVSETCPQPLPAGTAIWDAGSRQTRTLLLHPGVLPLPAGDAPCAPDEIPGIGGECLPVPAAAFSAPLSSLPLLKLSGLALPALARTDDVPVIPYRPGYQPQRPDPATHKLFGATAAMLASLGHGMLAMSNWIGANADQTKDGHPIIVAGPQTGYFVPQLLWEAAVVSNGGTPFELAARGISTVNLPYITLGRGLAHAWSATSAGSDLIDTRVSRMCNTDGSPASREDANGDGFPDADGYLFKGQCVRFYKRLDEWMAIPTPASIALGGPPQPEQVQRFILRTHYGPVTHTATVNGAPVAISEQRSTFFGDVDVTAPFALLTTTGVPMTHTRFKQLFNSTSSTFNWIYVDSQDLAYIQSGLYPQRHPGQHPELPVWGDGNFEWAADQNLPANFFTQFGGDGDSGAKSFPSRAVAVAQGDPSSGYFEWPGYLPLASHIQDTNPSKGFLANWNNAGARSWWAADSNGSFGPTHRVEMLQQRLLAFRNAGRKHDVASMIEIMADAAFTDLRGQDLLPLLLQIIQSGPLTADQQAVVDLMQQWRDEGSNRWITGGAGLGSYRRDRDNDGSYDMRAAVVLMDAWYPHLIDAVLPQMVTVEGQGASLLTGRYDAPRAQGSAYQEGWYQHMKRVLEMALNTPGHTNYRVLRCANSGDPAVCRSAVLTALEQALTTLGGLANQANWDGTQLANQQGEAGVAVEEYDNVHHTSFSFLPVANIHWINRPTWQQVVQVK